MKPDHELAIRHLLLAAETGSAKAAKLLGRLATHWIRAGEPIPPLLRNFVADQQEGRRKPKSCPNRDRDIAICEAHLAEATIASLAERYNISERHVASIVSKYRDYCVAIASLEKTLASKSSCLSPDFEPPE